MFIAAALVVMAACNKVETPVTKSLSLKADVEQHDDVTKTSLSGSSVFWTANDQIAVFDNADTPLKAQLRTDSDGVTNASFTDVNVPSGFNKPTWAIYPYSAETSATNAGVITFTVDGTQNYVMDSFDPAHNVMVGTVVDSKVAFKNAFGLLKLQLKGVMRVGKIELTGGNNEKLYGTFTANAASDYTAEYSTGGGETITLDCTGVGGVQLTTTVSTAFYFVVPVGAFGTAGHGGFTATVYDYSDYNGESWGGSAKYRLNVATTRTSNVINRSKVRAMNAATVSLLPSDYTQVQYLQSDGNQYITTSYTVDTTKDFTVEAGYNDIGGERFILAGSYCGTSHKVAFFCLELSADNKLRVCSHPSGSVGNNDFSDPVGINVDNTYTFDYKASSHTYTINYTKSGSGSYLMGPTDLKLYPNTSEQPLRLFIDYRATYNDPNKDLVMNPARIIFFTIREGSTLKLQYVACKNNSTDKYGFYDMINDTFVGNGSGVGDFTAGPEIPADFQR